MPLLPPGWSMSNNSGSYTGPAALRPPQDDEMDEGGMEDGNEQGLDIRPDSPGWEDIDDDSEDISVACLMCQQTFPSITLMLDHCVSAHNLDFLAVCRRDKDALDFYGAIKLVNYIRTQARSGVTPTELRLDDATQWQDDKYMQPVIENDALLFSLDDIIDLKKTSDEKPVDYDEMQAAAAARQQHENLDSVPE